MAIRKYLYPAAQVFQPELVVVAGRVAIGASGAVGAQTGKGFSVTRTGAGLYSITLDADSGVGDILHCSVDLAFATANNTQTAKILTITAGTGVITIQCNDAGTVDTAADPPSGSILLFSAVVQNASYTG